MEKYIRGNGVVNKVNIEEMTIDEISAEFEEYTGELPGEELRDLFEVIIELAKSAKNRGGSRVDENIDEKKLTSR